MSEYSVLVVDDDRLVLATLAEGLRQAGYRVIEATSGEEAIQLACSTKPDLALLDMRLPGKGGLEVAGWLRENTDIPFLFLSAYSDSTIVSEAVRAGALGYLVKPLDLPQILPSIESALTRGRELLALLEEEAQLIAALRLGRETSLAIGILMARYRLNEQEAFDRLRKQARSERRKISEIALELVLNAGDAVNNGAG